MKYYAVQTNRSHEPEVFFKYKRQADRYADNEKNVWKGMKPKLKFTVRTVDIPRPARQKLVVNHEINWLDYVSYGLKLLLNSFKRK